jgi:hypothetical protein
MKSKINWNDKRIQHEFTKLFISGLIIGVMIGTALASMW